MQKRKIIHIDEEKCNGCGECIPNCPEGALQIIDDKVRLISDLFCDGLGACIGHCPVGAISIEERQAQEYEERKVMANIIKQGKNVIKAHLMHLKEHNQARYLNEAIDFLKENKIEVPELKIQHQHNMGACPGSKMMDFRKNEVKKPRADIDKTQSQLGTWPVQINLVPPFAPYFDNAHLLISADCVPFAYPDFHSDLLAGKVLLIGCPKLDDVTRYLEKITAILKSNSIKSITYAHMEVPCCFGLIDVIKQAIKDCGKDVPFDEVIISISGARLQ